MHPTRSVSTLGFLDCVESGFLSSHSETSWASWTLTAGNCFVKAAQLVSSHTRGPFGKGCFRWGEARHPGPEEAIFAISFSNPSGIWGKESHVLDLPPGILTFAETHLSSVTLPKTISHLRSNAARSHRRLRVLPSVPVSLRPNSQSAGVWSGILHLSDLGCHSVSFPWPGGEFQLGRVQTSKFFMQNKAILGCTAYGWPTSPSWPHAKKATASLLQQITENFIVGTHGLRFLSADINGSDEDFPILAYWESLGWIEVQSLQQLRTGDTPLPTCRGRTRPDRLYLSPELASWFHSFELRDVFADHSTLIANFKMPVNQVPLSRWPMTTKIPWPSVDLQAWHAADVTAPSHVDFADSTCFLRAFGQSYEGSFTGYCNELPNLALPPGACGRAAALAPRIFLEQTPFVRPSRQGEEKAAAGTLTRPLCHWFKQLRRLQSLLHNLRSNSTSPTAVSYRLLTWSSIRSAAGFAPNFVDWWPSRLHRVQGSPLLWPTCLPSVALLECLFMDFRTNYRAYESWHLCQQKRIAQEAMKESLGKAFKAVIGKPQLSLDHLEKRASASIVNVDPVTHAVTVDSDIPCTEKCVFRLDGVPASVVPVGPRSFQVHSDLLLCPGQELQVSEWLTDPVGILEEVRQFWALRWQRHAQVPAGQWDRVLQFIDAYTDPLPFEASPLSVAQWDVTNQRYQAHAARGPDSFDHLDLRRMPSSYKSALVSMFNSIESGLAWPQQLLLGTGHCLPKHSQAALINEYRPIIVYSVLYRSWASWRSTGFLKTLSQCCGPRVKGFLNHREAGDVWFMVQALIEGAHMTGTSLMGCSTDVEKAFESIPRRPLRRLALALGLPSCIVDAWFRFLDSQARRFSLSGIIGASTSSDCGLPEGCGMSVLGMTLLDHCWDVYQAVFAPASVPLSYVDNYAILSTSLLSLLRGFASLSTFMDMWTLRLDARKTYMWAVEPSFRAAIRQLGFSVKHISNELGGALAFSRRSPVSLQLERIQSLDSSWNALRRLQLPVRWKEQIIRQAFWPKALHAAVITPMPRRHLASLRTKAVRALGHGNAGAHPGIRLCLLSSSPDTDPAFYQLHRCFMDFLRLLRKAPSLLDVWRDVVMGSARPTSGPFAKLNELCAQIAWTVTDPPCVEDHDGVLLNLLTIPTDALYYLLWEAWLQSLAREVAHRKDFDGLHGLHWFFSGGARGYDSLQLAQLAALREGAFITRQHKGKFDLFTGDRCVHCGLLDSLDHRATTCPAYREVRSRHPEVLRRWSSEGTALRERLLLSRNPYLARLKFLLMQTEDLSDDYSVLPKAGQRHDLFTDGSAHSASESPLGYAAWAVVSATHHCVLMSGPLPGLWQTANRAELFALLTAIKWCLHYDVNATLWSDSSYASTGLHALLDGNCVEYDSNQDLWETLTTLVSQLRKDQIWVQHVSGHSAQGAPDDLVAWMGYWNQAADTSAGIAQGFRSTAFFDGWSAYLAHEVAQNRTLRTFEAFQLDLATHQSPSIPDWLLDDMEEEDTSLPLRVSVDDHELWSETLPPNWQQIWRLSSEAKTFGTEFICSIFEYLGAEEPQSASAFPVSWLELSALAFSLGFVHPVAGLSSKGHSWVDESMVPIGVVAPLSVAARVRYISAAFRAFAGLFDLPVLYMQKIDRAFLGISVPLQGVRLLLTDDSITRIDHTLRQLTESRPIRRSNDMCRPFSRA